MPLPPTLLSQEGQYYPRHLQPPPQQHEPSAPWTLGSTDGAYAVSLALNEQKPRSLEGTEVTVTGGGHVPAPEIFHTGAVIATNTGESKQALLSAKKSLYQDRLFRQSSASVEAVLAASCEVMGFDIAEMWARTGPKTHQLTNSHLRPTALEDSVRKDLVDVYYGDKSSERTHRLSPALCKRAKEAGDVVWVTAHSSTGAEALRCSISNVRTAVAVPVCHEASNTNVTIIFFSIRRCVMLFVRCCFLSEASTRFADPTADADTCSAFHLPFLQLLG